MLCPACDCTMRPWLNMPIDAKKDAETPYAKTVRCDGCGLGAIDPLPAEADVAALYDLATYYTHGESHIREVPPRTLDKVLVRLAWQVDRATPFDVDEIAARLPAGGSVLDMGCGDAELLKAFADLGFDVVGVDPDGRSRALAAARGITVLNGTAERPPTALKGGYDLIVMSHSLEHCREPAVAIANIAALLSPTGLAYIEVPNAGCRHFETFLQCSEMFDAPRHLWFFTPAALRHVAEGAGLAVSEWRYNGYTRHFLPSWRAWEREIFARLKKRGRSAGATEHSLLRSFDLLRRSAFAPPERKYDSIGILTAMRPAASPTGE